MESKIRPYDILPL